MGKAKGAILVGAAAVGGWFVHAFEPEIKGEAVAAMEWIKTPVGGAFMLGLAVAAVLALTLWWIERPRVIDVAGDFKTKIRVQTNWRCNKVLAVLGHWCSSYPACEGALFTDTRSDGAGMAWRCGGSCGFKTSQEEFAPYRAGDVSSITAKLERHIAQQGRLPHAAP